MYEVHIFSKSSFIPRSFQLSDKITVEKITPLRPLDEMETIVQYCHSIGIQPPPKKNQLELINEPKLASDACVFIFRDIAASSHDDAPMVIKDDVLILSDVITNYQMQKGYFFAFLIIEWQDDKYSSTLRIVPKAIKKVINLPFVPDEQILIDQFNLAKSSNLNRLYINLFAEVVQENNIYFQLVKNWALLETMAIRYGPAAKKTMVRDLYADHNLSIQSITNDIDILDFLYKCRNNIAHEGDLGLEKLLNSKSKYAPYIPRFEEFSTTILSNTRFLINRFQYY